jgi:hypothetical protein
MEERKERRTRRASDNGWLCVVAQRLSQVWDFIDRRQIDAYAVSGLILWGSFRILFWSFEYALHADRPGIEVAAIIGAIGAPWAGLQAVAIKFVLEARKSSFEN